MRRNPTADSEPESNPPLNQFTDSAAPAWASEPQRVYRRDARSPRTAKYDAQVAHQSAICFSNTIVDLATRR
jgi:hypothetical protein